MDEDDHYDELDEGLRHHDERGKDEDYALETERTDTRLTIHYAKVDDSTRRLRELVAAESICCAFAGWTVDMTHADLRLIITGTPQQLATLNVRWSAHPTRGNLLTPPCRAPY